MAHETLKAFGYPGTLIQDYTNWVVVLRPHQATLGDLVIIHKSNATAFSDLDGASFAELEMVIKNCEAALKDCFDYQKINYMMLMMKDPQVHYHVIPRYSDEKSFDELSFQDAGWPALPDLAGGHKITKDQQDKLIERIQSSWPV